MRDISDVLTVSFDSGSKDESALCVSRKHGEKINVLKMELGEQADVLYHLLTEQMTKAEIKALEQEPIFDKIRAEISDFEEEAFHRPNTDYSDYAAIRHCLEIIDKYKESEE